MPRCAAPCSGEGAREAARRFYVRLVRRHGVQPGAVQPDRGRPGSLRGRARRCQKLAPLDAGRGLRRPSVGRAALSGFRRVGRGIVVGRRLPARLGGPGRDRPVRLQADARPADGTAISLALQAQGVAGLGGAALSSMPNSTVVEGVKRGGTHMRKIYGTLAVAAVALMATRSFAQIKIGVAGPMTGQNATFGEQMNRGATMAVGDINAAGGVNGKKLELVVGDDACDPKQATAVANKMVSDKVVFLAGHYFSGSS